MELEVSHVQNLSSLPPIVDNIFDNYNNKKFGTHKIFFQIMTEALLKVTDRKAVSAYVKSKD